jgi:excisionase family DNA binding protein
MAENYFTIAEAAAAARVSPRTVTYEVERGNLRCRRFGRAVRFAESDVANWLAGRDAVAA